MRSRKYRRECFVSISEDSDFGHFFGSTGLTNVLKFIPAVHNRFKYVVIATPGQTSKGAGFEIFGSELECQRWKLVSVYHKCEKDKKNG